MLTLEAELAALLSLSLPELRLTWRRLHCGEPTVGSSRDLLMHEIAYKKQEQAYGGLAPAVRRKLRVLAQQLEANGGGALAPPTVLKPGTRLMREWGGRTHTATVCDSGFEYDGERHPSLTRIACQITGTHWSGPRFFGLHSTAGRPRVGRSGA